MVASDSKCLHLSSKKMGLKYVSVFSQHVDTITSKNMYNSLVQRLWWDLISERVPMPLSAKIPALGTPFPPLAFEQYNGYFTVTLSGQWSTQTLGQESFLEFP